MHLTRAYINNINEGLSKAAGHSMAKGDDFLEQGNYDEAENCYRKAAEQGIASGQYGLGGVYELKEQYTEAVEWYKKAVEQGHAEA